MYVIFLLFAASVFHGRGARDMYARTKSAYVKGLYSVVEGTVINFHPMPYSGHQERRFQLMACSLHIRISHLFPASTTQLRMAVRYATDFACGLQLKGWWKSYGRRIVSANIRHALRATEVNNEIRQTATLNPERFWYFNNGITLVAEDASKAPAGAASRSAGVFSFKGASIVNGAQTVSSLARVDNDTALGNPSIIPKYAGYGAATYDHSKIVASRGTVV
jgi:AIPR protein